MAQTKQVAVLADFTDERGQSHARGDEISVDYETKRQRTAVNRLIYRGFVTLDVKQARTYTQTDEPEEEATSDEQDSPDESDDTGAAKKTTATRRRRKTKGTS